MHKISLLFVIFCSSFNVFTQNDEKVKPIPLKISPWYLFEPLTIETNDFSNDLKNLSQKNSDSLITVFSKKIDSISIESLYIFSVRLYDIGKKDESVYWFHTAKLRAAIFIKALDQEKIGGIGSKPFELKQAYIAFNQLAGEYINGYAGGDVDKWVETLKKVQTNVANLESFKLYTDIAFLGEADFFEVKQDRIDDYTKLIDYLVKNKKNIKKSRKKNGIDGKY